MREKVGESGSRVRLNSIWARNGGTIRGTRRKSGPALLARPVLVHLMLICLVPYDFSRDPFNCANERTNLRSGFVETNLNIVPTEGFFSCVPTLS